MDVKFIFVDSTFFALPLKLSEIIKKNHEPHIVYAGSLIDKLAREKSRIFSDKYDAYLKRLDDFRQLNPTVFLLEFDPSASYKRFERTYSRAEKCLLYQEMYKQVLEEIDLTNINIRKLNIYKASMTPNEIYQTYISEIINEEN